jgi:hypothetical protein
MIGCHKEHPVLPFNERMTLGKQELADSLSKGILRGSSWSYLIGARLFGAHLLDATVDEFEITRSHAVSQEAFIDGSFQEFKEVVRIIYWCRKLAAFGNHQVEQGIDIKGRTNVGGQRESGSQGFRQQVNLGVTSSIDSHIQSAKNC